MDVPKTERTVSLIKVRTRRMRQMDVRVEVGEKGCLRFHKLSREVCHPLLIRRVSPPPPRGLLRELEYFEVMMGGCLDGLPSGMDLLTHKNCGLVDDSRCDCERALQV